MKRLLAVLPYSPQCLSPSPYFDQSLFHYDEKVPSAHGSGMPWLVGAMSHVLGLVVFTDSDERITPS